MWLLGCGCQLVIKNNNEEEHDDDEVLVCSINEVAAHLCIMSDRLLETFVFLKCNIYHRPLNYAVLCYISTSTPS